jgi:hypothetical protein
MIKENLKYIEDEIKKVCEKENIDKNACTLIAVSKTKPIELIKEAYDYGIRDFGENKVQEILEKYEQLPKDIRWHMIGHLQTNKVKMILDKVEYIHSIDSLKLASVIDKEAKKKGIVVKGFLELNIVGEETKFGFSVEELNSIVEELAVFGNLRIIGLMIVAPFVDIAEKNREIFKKMKKIAVDINAKKIHNVEISELSMGMSGDYLVAIEEGSTFVRVGSSIFGER